jgi:hypothetical protein
MEETTMTQTAGRLAVDQQLVTTGFSIPPGGIEAKQITYHYDTMPGNQPASYADTVFIWQTSRQEIPVGTPWLYKHQIPNNTPNGDDTFDQLDVTVESYLLGLGVGPDVKNICATIFVPAQAVGGDPTLHTPAAVVTIMGTNTVSFQYTMPPGSQPGADGDWAGLWEGQPPSALYGVPPKWFAPVDRSTSQGSSSINGVTILRNTQYTLGYFKGGYQSTRPKQTTLACAVMFPKSS